MADILDAFKDAIRSQVCSGDTHEEVSCYLQAMFVGTRGLSARSVRRFCSSRRIHYGSNMEERELDEVVRRIVSRVGRTYGRSLHG